MCSRCSSCDYTVSHNSGLFFFNEPAPTGVYTYGHTLSLHDALPSFGAWLGGVIAERLDRRGVRESQLSATACACVIQLAAIAGATMIAQPWLDRKSTRLNSSH